MNVSLRNSTDMNVKSTNAQSKMRDAAFYRWIGKPHKAKTGENEFLTIQKIIILSDTLVYKENFTIGDYVSVESGDFCKPNIGQICKLMENQWGEKIAKMRWLFRLQDIIPTCLHTFETNELAMSDIFSLLRVENMVTRCFVNMEPICGTDNVHFGPYFCNFA